MDGQGGDYDFDFDGDGGRFAVGICFVMGTYSHFEERGCEPQQGSNFGEGGSLRGCWEWWGWAGSNYGAFGCFSDAVRSLGVAASHRLAVRPK